MDATKYRRYVRERDAVNEIEAYLAEMRTISAIKTMRTTWPEYGLKEAYDYVRSFPAWKRAWAKAWPEYETP